MLGACFSPEVLILNIRKYASMYMFDAKTGIVFSIWYCRCISQKSFKYSKVEIRKRCIFAHGKSHKKMRLSCEKTFTKLHKFMSLNILNAFRFHYPLNEAM